MPAIDSLIIIFWLLSNMPHTVLLHNDGYYFCCCYLIYFIMALHCAMLWIYSIHPYSVVAINVH